MSPTAGSQSPSLHASNHRVVVAEHGGPGVLEMVDEAVPQPGPGEVRVAVLAAGVSAYDLMFRKSRLLPGTPRVPFTLGEDVVGIVDALGKGTREFEVGQRVAGTTISLGVGGGYSEFVCLPADELVPVPEGIDPAKAVCVPVNYLTAYAAMHRTAQVRSGQRVLIHGAAGGVGSALVELGRLAGLQMYGTASTDNLEFVAELGATPIDYRNEDFVERVGALTGGGVDVVFDPIGGFSQLRRSFKALNEGGRLVWFGVASTKQHGLRVIPATLLMRALLAVVPGRRKVMSTELGDDKAWTRATLLELFELLARGEIDPVVAARVPLNDAAQAHALLERGGHRGKAVLMTRFAEAGTVDAGRSHARP